MIVYLATHRTTGLIYVGATRQHLEVRKYMHGFERKARDRPFIKALREVGVDGFEWRVLETFDDADAMFEGEKVWIARLRACNPERGYNATTGGRGGASPYLTPQGREATIATKLRRRRNWKNKALSATQRAAIAQLSQTLGPRRRGAWLSASEKSALRKLRALGVPYARIAKAFGVSLSTVWTHRRRTPKRPQRKAG